MSGRLAGKRILVLSRLSGDQQIGNYSEEEQIDGLVRFVKAEGGVPVPLSENVTRRGVSGQDLKKRTVASEALERVEAGEAEGIGWYDYKRLSRNKYLEDQGQILRRMAARRAVIVLLNQIIHPWLPDERMQFQVMAAATADGSGLRDTFYRGQFGRARREPFVKGTPPLGFATVLVEYQPEQGALPKTKRIPAKDPRCAELMADLREWYASCRTYGEVAARVNERYPHLLGQAGNRVRKHSTAEGYAIWTEYQARIALENPRYAGWWGLGLGAKKSEMWETDTRRERADEYRHYKAELAYWTLAEAAEWRARFGRHAWGGRRTRARTAGADGMKRPPALTGVLACAGCGELLVGYGPGRYGCPLRTSGRCKQPQIITERCALRLLDTLAEEALSRVRGLADAIRRGAERARQAGTATERDLRLTEEQLATHVEEWCPAGQPARRIPDAIKQRMSDLQTEIDRLRERAGRERERQQAAETYEAREARVLSGSVAEQAKALRDAPAGERCEMWRELVTGVRIEAKGQGGARTHRVLPGWRVVRGEAAPDGAGTVDSVSTSRCASPIYQLPPTLLALLAPVGGA
jgi:Resolvase, N terminal domain